MRALVKSRSEPGLWMEDVPVPEPGINDVLIKVNKSAICGTDVHIYEWDAWAQKHIETPLVVGHEFAGTVAAIGSNVHDFKEGNIVSGEGHLVCGVCRNCLAGRRHLCAKPAGVGIERDGAYAEYLCISQTNVWYADPNIPMEQLACFDPFGNATHCALSFPMTGEDVLITGAGPIGLMATAIARHVAARYVVVTDVNPYRLELAKKTGATHSPASISPVTPTATTALRPCAKSFRPASSSPTWASCISTRPLPSRAARTGPGGRRREARCSSARIYCWRATAIP